MEDGGGAGKTEAGVQHALSRLVTINLILSSMRRNVCQKLYLVVWMPIKMLALVDEDNLVSKER